MASSWLRVLRAESPTFRRSRAPTAQARKSISLTQKFAGDDTSSYTWFILLLLLSNGELLVERDVQLQDIDAWFANEPKIGTVCCLSYQGAHLIGRYASRLRDSAGLQIRIGWTDLWIEARCRAGNCVSRDISFGRKN